MSDHSRTRGYLRYTLPALLSLLAIGLALGEEPFREALRYDRIELTNADYWRWLTGHLVHASWSHAWLNLAGLWVVWFLFKERLAGGFGWWIMLLSIITMDAGFWFRDTELGWYVGLSGLLHGFYTAAALDEYWRGVRGGVWLLLGVIAKLIYEQAFGALPTTAEASGGPVWVNSHLYGALGGLLAAVIWNWRKPFTPGALLRIFSRS